MSYPVPDPLPLRSIPVPAEVTRVAGCSCGGLQWHRAPGGRDPGCSIWNRPPGEAASAVDNAEARLAAYAAGLNSALHGRQAPAR